MQRTFGFFVSGGAAVALMALAACGSTTNATPNGGSGGQPSSSSGSSPSSAGGGVGAVPDACSFLSQSTAATITGDASVAKLSSGSSNTGATSTCIYLDTSNGGSATLVIERLGGAIPQQALQGALEQAVKNGNGQVQQVSGLGDGAYKEVTASSAGVVFAKGSTLVVIGSESKTRAGSAMEGDVENLAQQLAGRI